MGAPLVDHLLVMAATGVTLVVVVLMHYEGLLLLGRLFKWERTGRRGAGKSLPGPGRRVMLWVLTGLVLLHALEIVVFGVAYWTLLRLESIGSIAGSDSPTVFDAFYLSAMTYSTVGFGDLSPGGPIRWLAGAEALMGLMLVAWSASFAFMEMARHWSDED